MSSPVVVKGGSERGRGDSVGQGGILCGGEVVELEYERTTYHN